MANDRSALTDELKLREDNSDLIKIHPKLNCHSSPRLCFREIFEKNFGCEHTNAPITLLVSWARWYDLPDPGPPDIGSGRNE